MLNSPFDALSGIPGPFARRRRPQPFDPASLFANGEQGAFYDPSDLSTLFQDDAGTTPVTEPGQTVGLMLDKSQGLELGPEEVTNGDFSDGGAGWTKRGGPVEFSNNRLIFPGEAAAIAVRREVSFGPGFVEWEIEIAQRTAGNYRVRFEAEGSTVTDTASTASVGIHRGISYLPSSIDTLAVVATSDPEGEVERVSVRELPGNHATQPTAESRPVYQAGNGLHWLVDDGVDDSLTATVPDLGADATLWYATEAGATILTGQTIGAGDLEVLRGDNTFSFGAIDRALTATETTQLQTYLEEQSGV